MGDAFLCEAVFLETTVGLVGDGPLNEPSIKSRKHISIPEVRLPFQSERQLQFCPTQRFFPKRSQQSADFTRDFTRHPGRGLPCLAEHGLHQVGSHIYFLVQAGDEQIKSFVGTVVLHHGRAVFRGASTRLLGIVIVSIHLPRF